MTEQTQVTEETQHISRKAFVGRVGAGGLVVSGLAASLASGAAAAAARPIKAPRSAAGLAASQQAAYRIGSAIPITGISAPDGREMKNGTLLAVNELNRTGGIAGRKLEAVFVDTDIYTPDGVKRGFQKLVSEKVDAIAIGGVFVQDPSYEVVAAYGCPYLNASTSEHQVDLTRSDPKKYSMIFQVDPSEVWYGRGFVPFLTTLEETKSWKPSAHTIHILEGSLAYSQAISREAEKAAKESGKWKVVGYTPVVGPITDWSPVLNKLRSTKPGVIMNTWPSPPDLAAFMKQFTANPTNSLVYLQYGPSVPQFLELAGKAANGAIWSTVSGIYPDALGKSFVARYRAAYKRDPAITYASSCYDQVMMLARAWGKVGDPRNFKAVSDELRTMIHRGINGGYYMNNKGQTGLAYPIQTPDPSLGQGLLIFQTQNLQHRLIYPDPYTSGDFKPAPWQSA